ncbi:hypothetical protein LHK_01255 [Laribacter hongkongensis HLHK9]|uniref:Uncharacterized protein n=1 Tax=Laribacter hongkongensis (strain HLHK9) TaxID=557598 RepID=C1D705_LARHH|nr:hypothetical protein LHK_01255 [Laribacter hongkongensis HLHK9]
MFRDKNQCFQCNCHEKSIHTMMYLCNGLKFMKLFIRLEISVFLDISTTYPGWSFFDRALLAPC